MATFTSVVRKVHIYGSMPAVALALVFAATGLLLNNAAEFGLDQGCLTKAEATLSATLLKKPDREAVVAALRRSAGVARLVAAAPPADKGPANPDAAAGAAAGVGEREGAKVAKALQGLLPPGAKITRTVADSPVDGWFSDSGPGYLIEGASADGKTFRLWLVPRDWIGIRQLKDVQTRGEGTLVDKKCKVIMNLYDLEAYRAAYKALMTLGMTTPSLVNSGWWEATKIFEGRMDQADRIARDLLDRHCKTDAERDEAALSLVLLGVPARGVIAERALKGKGLARDWCVSALGWFGDKESARVLAQVLNDPTAASSTSRKAAMALGKIGDAETGPAVMAAFGRITDPEVSPWIGAALARIHYTDAAPMILERMNGEEDQSSKAEYAQQLARLGYTKAIPDIGKLCKVRDFTAEWALDRGEEKNYFDGLLEMSYLRLTGPWGKPADGVRLLLLGPTKATTAGPIKLALLVENVGDKDLDIIQCLSGNLFVNDVAHDVAPGMWDGYCILVVGSVWVWPYDLSLMIAGPGSYKVRYEVGDAKSGTITVEVGPDGSRQPLAADTPPATAPMIGLAATRGAVDTEQADYRRLCDIWRKTEPEAAKPKGTVTAEERTLLLQELDGHRGGIAPHDFRRMAAITLGNLQAREAVPKLIARLRDGQEHGMTRAEAARALGEIGDKNALAPLLDALGDEREAMDRSIIRVCAARALGALAPTAQDLKPLATPERFRALLATVEAIALPVTEPELLDPGGRSNNLHYAVMEVDALCLGLNLARPAELPAGDRTRAANLAKKLLQSGFPIYAFDPASFPDLARFCQVYQPDLYAERTKALQTPAADTPATSRSINRGEKGAATEAVPGGTLKVVAVKVNNTLDWKWTFIPTGSDKEEQLPSVPSLSSDVELLASPDGKYLAVLSQCEGCWSLDVVDLAVLLGKQEVKEVASADTWPGGMRLAGWEAGKLLVESDELLTHLRGDEEYAIVFSKVQRFSLDPTTGKFTAVSAEAKDPIKYFTGQLGANDHEDVPEAAERLFYATVALRRLKAVAALPDLRKALATRKDEDQKGMIQKTIDCLTALPANSKPPAAAEKSLPGAKVGLEEAMKVPGLGPGLGRIIRRAEALEEAHVSSNAVPGGTHPRHRQRMKVLEVFGWPDRTPDVLIDYPVDAGAERPLAKGEKVFWVADPYTLPVEDRGAAASADIFRPWLGIKALADTPENRKVVLASIGAVEVDGLQARLESNAYLHPRIGMQVTLYVKNVSDRSFALEFQSLPVQWEVLDSEGKGVEPAKVSKAGPKPVWYGYGPGEYNPVHIYGKSDVNRNGTLIVGACEWRLRPGRYTLKCVLQQAADKTGAPGNLQPWVGRLELPPVPFEVASAVVDKDLLAAAEKVRAAHPLKASGPNDADKETLYKALAELIRPGASVRQLRLVLPGIGRGLAGSVSWDGNFFVLRYPLDEVFLVEARGFGDRRSGTNSFEEDEEHLVIYAPPQIVRCPAPPAKTPATPEPARPAAAPEKMPNAEKPADLLPGSAVGLDEALKTPGRILAVATALEPCTTFSAKDGLRPGVQRFKVTELSDGPSVSKKVIIDYSLLTVADRPEREVAKDETVLWIAQSESSLVFGDEAARWTGLKALADTPENRKILASAGPPPPSAQVPGWIAALKDKDRDVRFKAIDSLGKARDPRGIAPLIESMRTEYDPMLIQSDRAARALAAIGGAAVEPLIAALKDEDAGIRFGAATALGRIKDRRATEPLLAALKAEKPVREPYAPIPENKGIWISEPPVRQTMAEALAAASGSDLGPLLAALKDPDANLRAGATAALGATNTTEGAEALVAVLKNDKDPRVRAAAAEAIPAGKRPLGIILSWSSHEPPRPKVHDMAVAPLIEAARDEAWRVRVAAAGALQYCEEGRVVETLIGLLKDADWRVRSSAVFSLGASKDPRAADSLLAVLRDKNEEPRVRQTAINGLETKGDVRAVEPLLETLKDPSGDLRQSAAYALGGGVTWTAEGLLLSARFGPESGPRVVPALIAALKDAKPEVRAAAASSLGHYKNARIIEPLLAALKDADANVRGSAITSLEGMKEPRAVEPLIAILGDKREPARRNVHTQPNGEVFSYSLGNRVLAARALGEIGDRRAVEPLIAAAKDPDLELRREALSALSAIRDPRAFNTFLAALKDPERQIRTAAIEAVAASGDPRAADALKDLLNDPDEGVRREAREALEKL